MPIKRRFYKRRYARRRSALSTRNIYSRKSAYNQATQIAALKKRVNRVYRACKPEVKVITDTQAYDWTLSSQTTSSNYVNLAALRIDKGAGDDQRVGDIVRRKDTYYISFEYYNSSDTGYHNSESSGSQIRCICGMNKQPQTNDSTPTLGDLILNYSSSGAGYTLAAVSPFKTELTEYFNIFKDVKFTITSSANQKMIKITTPWYTCRYSDVQDASLLTGKSLHSWLIVLASGLHYDNDFNEYVKFVMQRKTAFVDA